MKKLLIIAVMLLSIGVKSQIVEKPRELRKVRGIYVGVTMDSINLGGTTLYPDNSAPQRKPLFIMIDSMSGFNNARLLWDQSGGWKIYFKIYQDYYSYRHFMPDLPFYTYTINIPYDDFDVQGSGAGLEGYLPTKIKAGIAALLGVPLSKVTIGSLYDN